MKLGSSHRQFSGSLPDWAARQIQLITSVYLDTEGILVTEISANGSALDNTPLVADLGDVLPFLVYFGEDNFAITQVDKARKFLKNGLFSQNGRIHLYHNHDWLLGLLEIAVQLGDQASLDLAVRASNEIIDNFFYDDLLVDELPSVSSPRSMLFRSSPFNLGYIELWLELAEISNDSKFAAASKRLATRWIRTDRFKQSGLLGGEFARSWPIFTYAISNRRKTHVQLFKENTNAIWAILDLHISEPDNPTWHEAIKCWILGFETWFLNNGQPWLYLDGQLNGRSPSLLAAFSSIDLLTDIGRTGSFGDRPVELANTIAQRWCSEQWCSGLFPASIGDDVDHLDANVDMIVSLMKLSALTHDDGYRIAAEKCKSALLDQHVSPYGMPLSVRRDGEIADGRLITKYQALALKLAVLPDEPATIIQDNFLTKLLRDR